jgi:branched-chain amino acid transport system permease protein
LNEVSIKTFKRVKLTLEGRIATYALFLLLAIILSLIPPFMGAYIRTWITQVLIYSIFALSLNLIFGYTGLFSMGHAAFFGAGAYTAGILTAHFGIRSFWLLMPAGIFVATFFAAVFGVIALRASGIYFLFITMALGELLSAVALRWKSVTGGSNGLFVPYPELGLRLAMNSFSYYYLVLTIFVTCVLVLYFFIKSPFALALQGVRDHEHRMRHMGYNTWLYKYVAFIIAGLFAGVAGVLFGPFGGSIVPSLLGTVTSALVMLMVVIGSDRIFFGPIIGSTIILFLQYYASVITPDRWPLILGAVFVIAVVFLRGGVSVHLLKLWNRVKYRYGSTKA